MWECGHPAASAVRFALFFHGGRVILSDSTEVDLESAFVFLVYASHPRQIVLCCNLLSAQFGKTRPFFYLQNGGILSCVRAGPRVCV